MKYPKYVAICTATAASALLGLGSGHMYAYLTDRESANNILTVGDVAIDLVEPNFPGNGSEEVKDLVPNQAVPKDPHIVNTGTNEAIVFCQLRVPMRTVTQVDENGQKLEEPTLQEVFYLPIPDSKPEKTLSEQAVGKTENGWTLLSKETLETEAVYLFGYTEKLLPETDHTYQDGDINQTGRDAQAGTQTTDLFSEARLKNIIEGEIETDDSLHIDLTAYAIQAEAVLDENDEDLTGSLTFENLTTIFRAFANQNADNPVPDAKGHNQYGIPDGN